jgi:formylglycine-generating enzyme
MTAPTRAETIASGAAGDRRGGSCCSLSGQANAGVMPATADREDMVYLAGGNFLMGSNSFYREERPVRPAHVDGFWIDIYPVTNAEFRKFVDATGYVTYSERPPKPEMYPDADPALLVPGSLVFKKPDRPVSLRDNLAWWEYRVGADWRHPRGPQSSLAGRDDHPVVHIAYEDALAYAAWCGKELPTEAEWEFAARGGLEGKAYPWGDAANPEGRFLANTWQGRFPYENLAEDGYDGTSPVDAFPPNGYGLFDMVGNVWEWTASLYDAAPDQPQQSCCHPTAGDDRTTRMTVKGGSHLCAPNYCLRYRPSARQGETVDSSTCHIGFRCVVRKPPGN